MENPEISAPTGAESSTAATSADTAMYQSLIPGDPPGDEDGDDPSDFFLADRPARALFFEDDKFTI